MRGPVLRQARSADVAAGRCDCGHVVGLDADFVRRGRLRAMTPQRWEYMTARLPYSASSKQERQLAELNQLGD